MENPPPRFGVDVGDPEAVDAAHAEAVHRGLRVVYPLTNEHGAFAAFSSRIHGTVVNVLAHRLIRITLAATGRRPRGRSLVPN